VKTAIEMALAFFVGYSLMKAAALFWPFGKKKGK